MNGLLTNNFRLLWSGLTPVFFFLSNARNIRVTHSHLHSKTPLHQSCRPMFLFSVGVQFHHHVQKTASCILGMATCWAQDLHQLLLCFNAAIGVSWVPVFFGVFYWILFTCQGFVLLQGMQGRVFMFVCGYKKSYLTQTIWKIRAEETTPKASRSLDDFWSLPHFLLVDYST